MKSNLIKFSFPVLLAFLLNSCATVPQGSVMINNGADIVPIQKEYSKKLAKIHIGTTLYDFKKILPSTYSIGQNGFITAYELDYSTSFVTKAEMHRQNLIVGFGSPSPHSYMQKLWFYFFKGHLIRWGRPGAWPEHPELILKEIIKHEN